MWLIELDGQYLVRMGRDGMPVWGTIDQATMMRQWQAEAQAGHIRVHFGLDAFAVAVERKVVVEVSR